MIEQLIAFFTTGPGRPFLPAFQGSFTLAYPSNAPFPADVAATHRVSAPHTFTTST